jgi:hypothetical protein
MILSSIHILIMKTELKTLNNQKIDPDDYEVNIMKNHFATSLSLIILFTLEVILI